MILSIFIFSLERRQTEADMRPAASGGRCGSQARAPMLAVALLPHSDPPRLALFANSPAHRGDHAREKGPFELPRRGSVRLYARSLPTIPPSNNQKLPRWQQSRELRRARWGCHDWWGWAIVTAGFWIKDERLFAELRRVAASSRCPTSADRITRISGKKNTTMHLF